MLRGFPVVALFALYAVIPPASAQVFSSDSLDQGQPISSVPLPGLIVGSVDHFCPGAHRPDGHAPIGVMADHLHPGGEWMITLRWMRMEMDGLGDGTSSVNPDNVLGNPMLGTGFLAVPLRMTTDMLMLSGMYAPSDNLTLMSMVPYLQREMDLAHTSGQNFDTESSGLGDVRIAGLYGLVSGAQTRAHASLGLSFPTGSTTETDTVLGPGAVSVNARLPFPMQLGSGTYDLSPGFTWTHFRDQHSVGAQLMHMVRLGENDEGYTLGDITMASLWGAIRHSERWSTSLRLGYTHRENIDGSENSIGLPGGAAPPIAAPTADPNLQGFDRVDLFLGVNFQGTGGHRLALEVGTPVYQDVDGPQLETELIFTVGWQLAF